MVLRTAIGNCGSANTAEKLLNPTQLAGSVRLVCWNAIRAARMIGYHEKAAKIRIIGKAKISADRPPPRTHDAGVRRRRGCARETERSGSGTASGSPGCALRP